MARIRMFGFIDSHPQVEVQEREYLRLLGFPTGFAPEGRARELAEWARHWYAEHGRPWILARTADALELKSDRVQMDGVDFLSDQLRAQFQAAAAQNAALVAVSAGKECEEKARQ